MSVGFPYGFSQGTNNHLSGTNTIQPFDFKKITRGQFSDHRDIVDEKFRETSNLNLERVGAVSSMMNGLAFKGWQNKTKRKEVTPEFEAVRLQELTKRIKQGEGHIAININPVNSEDSFKSCCSCSKNSNSCCKSENQELHVKGSIYYKDNSTDEVDLYYDPKSTSANSGKSVYGEITHTSEDNSDEKHPVESTDTIEIPFSEKSPIVADAAEEFIKAVCAAQEVEQ